MIFEAELKQKVHIHVAQDLKMLMILFVVFQEFRRKFHFMEFCFPSQVRYAQFAQFFWSEICSFQSSTKCGSAPLMR